MQVLLIISGGQKNRQTRPPHDHLSPEVLILAVQIQAVWRNGGVYRR